MAPKSDVITVQVELTCAGIGVDDLVEEIGTLQLQLADARRSLAATDALAAEAVEVAIRYQRNGDRMAEMLAATVLANEEMARRLEWYRRILSGRIDSKMIALLREHRLNIVD